MLALFLLFVAACVVELYVALQVGAAIGALNTVALLVVISLVGVVVVKRQGLTVLGRMRRDVDAGTDPSRALLDGFLILVAGALLVFPGFVTDAAGVLLLIPPVRAVVAHGVRRRIGRAETFARGADQRHSHHL